MKRYVFKTKHDKNYDPSTRQGDLKLIQLFQGIEQDFIPISSQQRHMERFPIDRFKLLQQHNMVGISYETEEWETKGLFRTREDDEGIRKFHYVSDDIIKRVNSNNYPGFRAITGDLEIDNENMLDSKDDSTFVPWLYLKRVYRKQAVDFADLMIRFLELKKREHTQESTSYHHIQRNHQVKITYELLGQPIGNTMRVTERRFAKKIKTDCGWMKIYCHLTTTFVKVYKAKGGYMVSMDRVVKLYQREKQNYAFKIHRYGYFIPNNLLDEVSIEILNHLTPINQYFDTTIMEKLKKPVYFLYDDRNMREIFKDNIDDILDVKKSVRRLTWSIRKNDYPFQEKPKVRKWV